MTDCIAGARAMLKFLIQTSFKMMVWRCPAESGLGPHAYTVMVNAWMSRHGNRATEKSCAKLKTVVYTINTAAIWHADAGVKPEHEYFCEYKHLHVPSATDHK